MQTLSSDKRISVFMLILLVQYMQNVLGDSMRNDKMAKIFKVIERRGWVSYKVVNNSTLSVQDKTTDSIPVHADQLRNRACKQSELSQAEGIENLKTSCTYDDVGN
ncbi:hypothetical protein GJ496_007007 [Pomphorhynchus laevis]|nr:hypothetical protein GJ496_007007 [Pomphorhynchus laevis]